MEKNLKISVVIPTYNREHILRSAIDSLLNSGIKPFEIIVVDDGSSDNTEKMVHDFSEVKFLKQEHRGAAAARNKGGFAAQGDLIFFTDSDCIVDKNCLENINNEFLKDKELSVISCKVLGITKGFWSKCHDYSHFHSLMLPDYKERKFACGSGFVIKNNVFKAVKGFNENCRVAEDEDLGLRVYEQKGKIIYSPKCVVYHDHGRNSAKLFFKHPYYWAINGSVIPYLKYNHSQYSKLASSKPWFYLVLSPVISGVVALKIFLQIFPIDKKIIIYFPFIFLNKMAWCIGTYKFLKNENK